MEISYSVHITIPVTASNPQEAARFALNDLRDLAISGWTMDVVDEETGELHTVEGVE